MSKTFIAAIVAGTLFCLGLPVNGEELETPPVLNERTEEDYYQPQVPERYEPDTRAIIRQKAMMRGEQRSARLASLNWYGMSNSRPIAAPTPFTSMYSPAWQMPGGRPFAWFASSQPTYIIYTR
jgi:hypothetical protein